MKVLVAGATGALGAPTVRALIATRIKRDLGWSPQFPTYRYGVRDIARRKEAAPT